MEKLLNLTELQEYDRLLKLWVEAGKPDLSGYEITSNKRETMTSGTDDVYYPTINAVREFVNSSINSMTANYVTSDADGNNFPTKASLDNATVFYHGRIVYTPSEHDYVYVTADESRDNGTWRYAYSGTIWAAQVRVNEAPLTVAQTAAINSNITANRVNALDAHLVDNNNPHNTTGNQIGGMIPNNIITADSNGKLASTSISTTELNWIFGVTGPIQAQLDSKQPTLISGSNIKTINGEPILGNGDIEIKRNTPYIVKPLWNYNSSSTPQQLLDGFGLPSALLQAISEDITTVYVSNVAEDTYIEYYPISAQADKGNQFIELQSFNYFIEYHLSLYYDEITDNYTHCDITIIERTTTKSAVSVRDFNTPFQNWGIEDEPTIGVINVGFYNPLNPPIIQESNKTYLYTGIISKRSLTSVTLIVTCNIHNQVNNTEETRYFFREYLSTRWSDWKEVGANDPTVIQELQRQINELTLKVSDLETRVPTNSVIDVTDQFVTINYIGDLTIEKITKKDGKQVMVHIFGQNRSGNKLLIVAPPSLGSLYEESNNYGASRRPKIMWGYDSNGSATPFECIITKASTTSPTSITIDGEVKDIDFYYVVDTNITTLSASYYVDSANTLRTFNRSNTPITNFSPPPTSTNIVISNRVESKSSLRYIYFGTDYSTITTLTNNFFIYNCTNLNEVNLIGLRGLQNITNGFLQSSIQKLDLRPLTSLTSIGATFCAANNSLLTEINIGSLDFNNISVGIDAFQGIPNTTSRVLKADSYLLATAFKTKCPNISNWTIIINS